MTDIPLKASETSDMPELPTIPDYPSRSYQHADGFRTVPWDDWVGMRYRAHMFQQALEQAHRELAEANDEIATHDQHIEHGEEMYLEMRSRAEAAESRLAALEAALRELVRLDNLGRGMKQGTPEWDQMIDDYSSNLEPAWKAAISALPDAGKEE